MALGRGQCQTLVLNPCFASAKQGQRAMISPTFFPLSCLPCSAFPWSQQEQKHPNKLFVYAYLRLSSGPPDMVQLSEPKWTFNCTFGGERVDQHWTQVGPEVDPNRT